LELARFRFTRINESLHCNHSKTKSELRILWRIMERRKYFYIELTIFNFFVTIKTKIFQLIQSESVFDGSILILFTKGFAQYRDLSG
jgi:hypothetical protein